MEVHDEFAVDRSCPSPEKLTLHVVYERPDVDIIGVPRCEEERGWCEEVGDALVNGDKGRTELRMLLGTFFSNRGRLAGFTQAYRNESEDLFFDYAAADDRR